MLHSIKMKYTNKKVTVFIFLLSVINPVTGGCQSKDQKQIDNKVNEFFSWYLTAVNQREIWEFKPQFVEDESGMTTLDYKIYIENLKEYHFSDSLIEVEKESYKECIDNIEKIKYSELSDVMPDLDDYERTNCDFSNYYRWGCGQEAVEGIRITNIKITGKNDASVSIEFYETDDKGEKHYYCGKMIRMNKHEDQWKIAEFE